MSNQIRILRLCHCANLGHEGYKRFITTHHSACRYYDPEGDAAEIIRALLKGIRNWAADEDGVHLDACDAYDRAAMSVGEKRLKEAP